MLSVTNRLPGILIICGLSALLGAGVGLGSLVAVVAIPGILIAAAAAMWPRTFLVVMLAYIPVEPFLLKWVPGGASGVLSLAPEILLFIAAASAIMLGHRDDVVKRGQMWLFWLAGFVVIGMLSAWLSNIAWIDAVYWIRTNIRYMSAAFIVGYLGDRRWWLGTLAPVVAGGLILQSVVAVAEFVGGATVRVFFAPGSMVVGGREFVDYALNVPTGISGTLGFYNNFGLYSVLAAAVCAGALVTLQVSSPQGLQVGLRSRRLLVLALWAGSMNVLLSASRQSLLVLIAVAAAMVAVVGPRRIGRKMIPVAVGFLLAAVVAYLVPSLTGPLAWIPQRFGQVVGGQAITQSLQTDRLFAVVRVVPAVLAVSPLLGLGPGALSSMFGVGAAAGALSLSSEGVAYAQDVGWAGVFVQVGLLGVGMFVTLFWWLVALARRDYRLGRLDVGVAALLAGAFTVWAAGMVASSPQLVRSTSLLLWSIMGLCLGGYRLAKSSEDVVE